MRIVIYFWFTSLLACSLKCYGLSLSLFVTHAHTHWRLLFRLSAVQVEFFSRNRTCFRINLLSPNSLQKLSCQLLAFHFPYVFLSAWLVQFLIICPLSKLYSVWLMAVLFAGKITWIILCVSWECEWSPCIFSFHALLAYTCSPYKLKL